MKQEYDLYSNIGVRYENNRDDIKFGEIFVIANVIVKTLKITYTIDIIKNH